MTTKWTPEDELKLLADHFDSMLAEFIAADAAQDGDVSAKHRQNGVDKGRYIGDRLRELATSGFMA